MFEFVTGQSMDNSFLVKFSRDSIPNSFGHLELKPKSSRSHSYEKFMRSFNFMGHFVESQTTKDLG